MQIVWLLPILSMMNCFYSAAPVHCALSGGMRDIDAHVRMMNLAGIDAAVLSSMVGFDQPDLSICRTINDDMREVENKHPGRFIGLAHVPALKGPQAAA